MNETPLFPLHVDWEVSTLGEIAKRGGGTIQTGPFGSQLHASDYVQEGIPSIMPKNISTDRISEEGIARITLQDAERLSKYRVHTGDIVYSRRGDVERRALVRDENDGWLCGTGCLKVSFGKGVTYPEYAAFYLSHAASKAWVVQHAVGATMPNLNTSILSALPFVLPPMDEQIIIADALASLDDKIELNRRMNETLKEMARALFKDWFVDFGPTRRQIAGETNPTKIMGSAFPPEKAKELAPIFSTTFGINGLPEGWTAGAVSDLADLNPTSWSAKKHPEQVEYVDLGNTKWGRIEETTDYSWSEAPSRAKRVLEQNDIIVGTVRPGNGSYALIGKEGLTGSTGFAVLRPKITTSTEFIYLALTSVENIDNLANLADGGAYPAINPKVVASTKVVLADSKIMESFSHVTKYMFAKCHVNEKENQTLAALRDLLLPKLMSGEIRLKNVEGMI